MIKAGLNAREVDLKLVDLHARKQALKRELSESEIAYQHLLGKKVMVKKTNFSHKSAFANNRYAVHTQKKHTFHHQWV